MRKTRKGRTSLSSLLDAGDRLPSRSDEQKKATISLSLFFLFLLRFSHRLSSVFLSLCISRFAFSVFAFLSSLLTHEGISSKKLVTPFWMFSLLFFFFSPVSFSESLRLCLSSLFLSLLIPDRGEYVRRFLPFFSSLLFSQFAVCRLSFICFYLLLFLFFSF